MHIRTWRESRSDICSSNLPLSITGRTVNCLNGMTPAATAAAAAAPIALLLLLLLLLAPLELGAGLSVTFANCCSGFVVIFALKVSRCSCWGSCKLCRSSCCQLLLSWDACLLPLLLLLLLLAPGAAVDVLAAATTAAALRLAG
jgi:hypothetical protein